MLLSHKSSCPVPVLSQVTERTEFKHSVMEEGKGMNRCLGRMGKTFETLISSLLPLFVCCLLERNNYRREA